MPAPAFVVTGAEDLRRSFRRAQGTTRDLSRAHRKVSKVAEGGAKRTSGTRQQERAKRALLGKGGAKSADLAIRNLSSMPFGLGAFLGARAYPQFPDWVGNRWDLLAGDGPYVIAEAIQRDRDEILDAFEQHVADALTAAGLTVT